MGNKRDWLSQFANMEAFILGLLGAALVAQHHIAHGLGVIAETIILVVFLGGLMGITPSIRPPSAMPKWAYPLMSGYASMFMDSFLVLLMVGKISLSGNFRSITRFKALNMIAALIGGLGMYFGEVYMLPLALKYNMREWWSMFPILPPICLFLVVLAGLCHRLEIEIETAGHHTYDPRDVLEFTGFIALLLIIKNPMFCLGLLFIYSWLSGQGIDMIEVIKTETEMSVMLLLNTALIIEQPAAELIATWAGWWAFVPAAFVSGVLTGAVYPATGNVWLETTILSTAVLFAPHSSLVGVMLFRRLSEWREYMKVSLPLMVIWFAMAYGWFTLVWPCLEDGFYAAFGGVRPMISAATNHL